jgi:protocatechuate 3,4-dioxygenase beta subunit
MFRRFLFAVLCLAASLVTGNAQSNFAVVRGSVLDPQHHPIAGAHVHLTAGGTGAQREVTANATGLYEIAGLQPGAYTLSVDSPGFANATQVINLEVG